MSARVNKPIIFCEIKVFQRVQMKDTMGNFVEISIGEFNVIDWTATFEIIQWLSKKIHDIDDIRSHDPYEIPIKVSIEAIDFGIKRPSWIKYMYYEQYISFISKIQEYFVPGNIKINGSIKITIPQSTIEKYQHTRYNLETGIESSLQNFSEIEILLRSYGHNYYGDPQAPQLLNVYQITDWQFTSEIIGWLSSQIRDIGNIESIHPDITPFIIKVKAPKFGIKNQTWIKYLNFQQYKFLYDKLEQNVTIGKVSSGFDAPISVHRWSAFTR